MPEVPIMPKKHTVTSGDRDGRVDLRKGRRSERSREAVPNLGSGRRALDDSATVGELSKATLAHITTVPMSLWAFFGGQIGYMKSQGLEVHGVSSPGPLLQDFANREGVPVHAVTMSRGISPLADMGAVVRLWLLLRRIRPDLVHAHTPKAALLGMIAACLARAPVRIYHMHGLRLTAMKGAPRLLLAWTERLTCALAHQVLCVSPSVRTAAMDLHLCAGGKIKVLAHGSINGVDAARAFNPSVVGEAARGLARANWRIPANATVIGFVGRLVRDKGVEELVESWRALREEFPDLYLLLVGPFEALDPVSPATERLLREDARVRLTGENWDTPALYATMDVFVLPTHREGFPLVPLEAAAMGLPVVGTRALGCVDAVEDGVTGALVMPGDVKGLTDALRVYLHNPRLRREHGANGRERVLRDYRPETIWRATYDEYARLLSLRRTATAADDGPAR